jgi:hypothetical protein
MAGTAVSSGEWNQIALVLAQNGTVTLSVNGKQKTERVEATHDFMSDEVTTLFIGGTKTQVDHGGVALPNFQGCISGFILNDAPLSNLSPSDRWEIISYGENLNSCDAVVTSPFISPTPFSHTVVIAAVCAILTVILIIIVAAVIVKKRKDLCNKKVENTKWKHVGSTLLPSETMSSALGLSHNLSDTSSALYVDNAAIRDDASFNIQYHINRQLDRAKRNQLTAPDLVSATPGNVNIVASGGMNYRAPSTDPYSEPMMPQRYTMENQNLMGGTPGSGIPRGITNFSNTALHNPEMQKTPQQGSLSTLLSLNQHHRRSSPLGRDFDSESEYSAFRSPHDNNLPNPYATNSLKADLYNALLGDGPPPRGAPFNARGSNGASMGKGLHRLDIGQPPVCPSSNGEDSDSDSFVSHDESFTG